jgi:hypothetical protein
MSDIYDAILYLRSRLVGPFGDKLVGVRSEEWTKFLEMVDEAKKPLPPMKFWWHMIDGKQLRDLDFLVAIECGGKEQVFGYRASNPPILDDTADSYKRLSFDGIKEFFDRHCGMKVGHIIWGKVFIDGSYQNTYVFAPGARVPFATIRPLRYNEGVDRDLVHNLRFFTSDRELNHSTSCYEQQDGLRGGTTFWVCKRTCAVLRKARS